MTDRKASNCGLLQNSCEPSPINIYIYIYMFNQGALFTVLKGDQQQKPKPVFPSTDTRVPGGAAGRPSAAPCPPPEDPHRTRGSDLKRQPDESFGPTRERGSLVPVRRR